MGATMSAKVDAQIRLLVQRGYSREQLIVDERTDGISCSVDDLAAAIALVQNPYKFDLKAPAMAAEIRKRLQLGYLPHHLLARSNYELIYDREQVTTDCELIAFGHFDE
jgi:hypothetical protein